jgi:hypothetical protein
MEVAPGVVALFPLMQTLMTELRTAGVQHFLAFDPAQGFSVPVFGGLDMEAERDHFAKLLGSSGERMEGLPRQLTAFSMLSKSLYAARMRRLPSSSTLRRGCWCDQNCRPRRSNAASLVRGAFARVKRASDWP